jgi:DnaJ-class molecular chaperone
MRNHPTISPALDAADFDPARWEWVRCAFCRGSGTDPFNLLSQHSCCESCHGRGSVLVPRPHVRCTYCNGGGSDKTFRCPVCRGAGEVGALPEPTVVCPECGGRGCTVPGGLECLNCRGRGHIPAFVPSTEERRTT